MNGADITGRTPLPRWVWGVLAWLVVVAATSTFAWLAISRAGDEVLAAPSQPSSDGLTSEVTGDVTAGGGSQAPMPPVSIPTPVPPPASAEPPADDGSAGSGSSRPPGPTTSSPSQPDPPPAPPGPGAPGPATQAVDQLVPLTGGQATVRCAGEQISLRSATPAVGWTVLTEVRAGEVRVEFRSDDGQSKLRATCVGGRPSIETDDAAAD